MTRMPSLKTLSPLILLAALVGGNLHAAITEDEAQRIYAASPLGKYAAGNRNFGVFDMEGPSCSSWAAQRVLDVQNPPVLGQLTQNPASKLKLPPYQWRLSSMMSFLREHMDLAVWGRHLCVGMYDFVKPNAFAHPTGFVYLNLDILGQVRNPDAVLYHEFAHELQHWNDEPFMKDVMPDGVTSSARRSELQADCVGSALMGLMIGSKSMSTVTWHVTSETIREDFLSMGDFNTTHSNHHGGKVARGFSSQAGIRYANALIQQGELADIKSKLILDHCSAFIQRMDAKYGSFWPITSQLQ